MAGFFKIKIKFVTDFATGGHKSYLFFCFYIEGVHKIFNLNVVGFKNI